MSNIRMISQTDYLELTNMIDFNHRKSPYGFGYFALTGVISGCNSLLNWDVHLYGLIACVSDFTKYPQGCRHLKAKKI